MDKRFIGHCMDCGKQNYKYKPRCMSCSANYRAIPIKKRFFKSVKKTSTCWLWTACKTDFGHGLIWDRRVKRQIRAHRFSYELHKGAIPKYAEVLHRCDNPPCVRPFHLFLGSQLDNMHDAKRKGRVRSGEKHGMAKLTWKQVNQIRKFHKEHKFSQQDMAKMFKIHYGTIASIVHNRRWVVHS